MQARHYLRMLQQGWWIIILCGLSALILALASAYVATPLYSAGTRFIVSPKAAFANERDLISSLDTLNRRSIITTYSEVLDSRRIFDEAGDILQLAPADRQRYKVSTVALPEANVLELSVTGPNPQVAALLANTIGQQAIDYVTRLYQIYDISFLDQALPPEQPFSPQPLRDASVALVLGLAVGALLAILREQLRIPLEMFRQRNMTDQISRAYTRRWFQRTLEGELARGKLLSVGLVRLDGLQDLVESAPQPLVQRVLRIITSTLRNELRGHDIVGRWDDNSFVLMLPSTPVNAALRTMERIKIALAQPVEVQDGEFLHFEPIVGVSVRQGDESADRLVEQAEDALMETRQKRRLTI